MSKVFQRGESAVKKTQLQERGVDSCGGKVPFRRVTWESISEEVTFQLSHE